MESTIGTGGGKLAAIQLWHDAIKQMQTGNFPNNPTDEERADRVRIYEWQLALVEGNATLEQAFQEWARCDARWFLASRVQQTDPPKGDRGRQFLKHMETQRLREEKASLSKEEHRAASDAKGAFDWWYWHIEDHQFQAERHFMMLSRFGSEMGS